MQFVRRLILTLALSLLSAAVVAQNRTTADLQPLPLSFEFNNGQADPGIAFVAHAPGVSLLFSNQAIVFASCAESVGPRCATPLISMRFHGSKGPQIVGESQAGSANYYIGSDPTQWHTGIPMYRALRYREIYPGIDAVFHGYDGQLEYDFVLKPHANPLLITLDLSGASASIENGELVFSKHGQQFRFKRPQVYQEVNGAERHIPASYIRRADGLIAFQIGNYDHRRPLIIDPVVSYASYVGGVAATVNGTGVDPSGNVILTGTTSATGFPVTSGAVQSSLKGNSDAFVTKIDPTGSHFVYSTYFGGTLNDTALAVAVDTSGNAYIVGVTGSADLPTTANAFSKTCPSICNTPFAAKFAPDGSLVYSTYLGPSNAVARAIALDNQGNAYITGNIASSDLPLVNAFQSGLPEGVSTSAESAFVQKLDPTGSSLIYSTYLGGPGADIGRGIAVDSSGSAYVVGQTDGGFPVRNPLQADGPGAFITKFTPDGTNIVYSTLFGSSGSTEADAVAVDSAGAAYITGVTTSPDFPVTANAFKTICAGSTGTQCITPEAFAFVLDPSGTTVRYSTFLGEGQIAGIALDANGNAFITGSTDWDDFPLVNPLQPSIASGISGSDMFVTELNSTGMPLLSTVLGGYWTADSAGGVAVQNGTIYVGGTASNGGSGFLTHADFPLVSPMTSSICCASPVLAEISSAGGAVLSVSPRTAPIVVLRNLSSSTLTFNSISVSSDFQQSGDCGASLPPGGDCILYLKSTNTASTGTLTIDSSATSSPAVFTISKGTAADQNTSASLMFSPNDELRFPPTLLNESITRSVRVRNVGPGTGNVFLNTTGNFQSTNHCAGGVAPGASCTIDVTFTPTVAGTAGGQLGINNNATTIFMGGWGSTTALMPSATTVNFGTQYVGFPGLSRTVTLQNATNEPASYSGFNVSSAFAATSDCPATIPARGSCHTNLTFTPTTNATYQGTLTVAGASPITLNGIGRILSDLALSTLDVEFGYTLLAGPYPTQNVTVTNKSANTVNISAVSASEDFSATSNCVGALASQASCTISVKFVPTAEGDRNGQLSIIHDGTGSPQQAVLHGLGENYVRLTPSTVDFGHQAVGTTSGWQFLSVGNNSNQPVTISGISVSDPEFAIAQNPCATTLQPFFGCALQFTFTPTGPGMHQATVTVTTSNPSSTESATLQGIGDGDGLSLSTQSLTFGTVELGATAPSQSVTLTNSGNINVQISGISASGDFSETNNCPATLAGGAQCSVTVNFAPAAVGQRSGNLSITSNLSSSPLAVGLAGSGADFQLAAAASSATSQTVKAGQTATFVVEVSGNNGFSDSVTFACANVPAGYSCSTNPQSITVNSTAQNVTISVTTPTSTAGGMTESISVPPIGPMATLGLAGMLALLSLLMRRRKRSLIAATALAVLLSACGGGSGSGNTSTPPPVVTPQTHSITLTATSGAGDVKSTMLTVTVD